MAIRIDHVIARNTGKVKAFSSQVIDMHRTFTVAELMDGCVYLETVEVDAEGVETIELLFRRPHALNFRIISRQRHGEAHSPMRSYDRDTKYPLYSMVKL